MMETSRREREHADMREWADKLERVREKGYGGE